MFFLRQDSYLRISCFFFNNYFYCRLLCLLKTDNVEDQGEIEANNRLILSYEEYLEDAHRRFMSGYFMPCARGSLNTSLGTCLETFMTNFYELSYDLALILTAVLRDMLYLHLVLFYADCQLHRNLVQLLQQGKRRIGIIDNGQVKLLQLREKNDLLTNGKVSDDDAAMEEESFLRKYLLITEFIQEVAAFACVRDMNAKTG